ncbi:hypothetical protein BKA64DRAFT_725843 [Cadophora sp. MPI-SDFR-AT-0126]|nr:hypothetical protein BKA64DRAFT_725843 [Leotiomycetes sp. MPI-SDFR-AT-0126]
MPDPRSAIVSCTERYPRTSDTLYQLFLCAMSFECALSIARYDHNPTGSPPVFLTPAEMNMTHEHICKISAREADIPVEPLRYLIPYFMLCPSTITLIGVCATFVACLIKWRPLRLDSPIELMPFPIIGLFLSIEWTRILESIQMMLPITIWSCYFVRALLDPLYKLAMPVTYARQVELKKEARRLAKERWNKGMVGDIEAGDLRHVNEQTPLNGACFAGDGNGGYVEIPHNDELGREGVRVSYDELRSNPWVLQADDNPSA